MSAPDRANNPEFSESKVGVLAIDDEADFLEFVGEVISCDDVHFLSTTDPLEGLRMVNQWRPPVVLLDLNMPKLGGLDLLERILAINPNTDIVMLTADHNTESAVQAIQKGACDYLVKPIAAQRLRERVGWLVKEARQSQYRGHLEGDFYPSIPFEGMVGQSSIMREVFFTIRRIAPYFRTALIGGETGTGKELVARALHRLSPVSKGPFIVCNCAAITESLMESELFGYVRGAFTGANQDRIGLVEAANGGVLFLDEIGEMSQAMQAKLLRVFQNKEVRQVGSTVARHVDVRVVASTHRDLRRMVSQEQFREDLYYRLSMIEIKLPRLAERKEDLPLLEQHLLSRYANEFNKATPVLTRRAQTALSRYSWPGNIRELENILGRACMMTAESIDIRDLPDSIKAIAPADAGGDDLLASLEGVERKHILRVLKSVGGNKARAVEILQISRSTLYRILQGCNDVTEGTPENGSLVC